MSASERRTEEISVSRFQLILLIYKFVRWIRLLNVWVIVRIRRLPFVSLSPLFGFSAHLDVRNHTVLNNAESNCETPIAHTAIEITLMAITVGSTQAVRDSGERDVKEHEINIQESFEASSGAGVTVEYVVTSTASDPVEVHLRQHSNETVRIEETESSGDRWQTAKDGSLQFHGRLEPGESMVKPFRAVPTESDDGLMQLPSLEIIELTMITSDPLTEQVDTDERLRDDIQVESAPTANKRMPYNGRQKVIVSIPAYNEAGSIADVVRAADQYADEILVVDDGSVDDTATIAKSVGATVIEHETNQGYGAAIRTAFIEAKRRDATYLVTLDADGQHDPAEIPLLERALREGESDIVIGSRFATDGTTNAPLYRRVGIRIVNVMTNLGRGVLNPRQWIGDTQSGFRAFNRRAISSISEAETIGEGMHASTDIIFHAHREGINIDEVGASIDYDVENASTHNPLTHGWGLVRNILRGVVRAHPLSMLGVPGFVLINFAVLAASQSSLLSPSSLVFMVLLAVGGVSALATAICVYSLKLYHEE